MYVSQFQGKGFSPKLYSSCTEADVRLDQRYPRGPKCSGLLSITLTREHHGIDGVFYVTQSGHLTMGGNKILYGPGGHPIRACDVRCGDGEPIWGFPDYPAVQVGDVIKEFAPDYLKKNPEDKRRYIHPLFPDQVFIHTGDMERFELADGTIAPARVLEPIQSGDIDYGEAYDDIKIIDPYEDGYLIPFPMENDL